MSISTTQAFIDKVNKEYKSTLASRGNAVRAMRIPRFSSGVLSLDIVLGGGWPFGRISQIYGDESTGKTLLTLKASQSVQGYCRTCRLAEDICTCETFEPCVVAFIDVEGTFDPAWAQTNGFDMDRNAYIRPDYAEQALDILIAAIESGEFDLIVLDSIAALTPAKEIEDSTEQSNMGKRAILVNRAINKCVSSLNRLATSGDAKAPALLFLNQVTENIGVLHGDNRIPPGGRRQRFAASVLILTKAVKYEDGDNKLTAWAELSGVTKKNKTYVPRRVYNFKLALKDTDGILAGHVNNEDELVKRGKLHGLITRHDNVVGFGECTARIEDDLKVRLRSEPDVALDLWRQIIRMECCVDV